jgi:uncharacterized membrane protein YeaQ/YmgE (transglycosylase-associated protein family)
MEKFLATALYLLPFLLLWLFYERIKLRTSGAEIAAAVMGAVVCALPFLWACWQQSQVDNPADTTYWIAGAPPAVFAAVAGLLGALLGCWLRTVFKTRTPDKHI